MNTQLTCPKSYRPLLRKGGSPRKRGQHHLSFQSVPFLRRPLPRPGEPRRAGAAHRPLLPARRRARRLLQRAWLFVTMIHVRRSVSSSTGMCVSERQGFTASEVKSPPRRPRSLKGQLSRSQLASKDRGMTMVVLELCLSNRLFAHVSSQKVP